MIDNFDRRAQLFNPYQVAVIAIALGSLGYGKINFRINFVGARLSEISESTGSAKHGPGESSE